LIKNLEATIAELEDKLKEVDLKLSDPVIYNEHQEVLKLSKKRENFQNELDKVYAQWMEFEE